MAVSLAPVAHQQFLAANGAPLAGGFVFTYAAGTSTPLATYTDSTGSTPNAQPIVLDAGGFANIWLSSNIAYKFVVQNSASVTQWTVDNILNTVFLGVSPQKQIFTTTGTFTVPAGVTQAKVTVVGAGGAGGGSTAAITGGGGASGSASIKWLSGLTTGSTLNVTVGIGGTGVSGAAGNAGTNSTVASGTQIISTITATGGAFGSSNSFGAAGIGSTGSGGDLNFGGTSGFAATFITGGAIIGGQGGSSIFGGGGQGNGNATGLAGIAPGAGGGGSGGAATNTGGAGANGIVIFEWTA